MTNFWLFVLRILFTQSVRLSVSAAPCIVKLLILFLNFKLPTINHNVMSTRKHILIIFFFFKLSTPRNRVVEQNALTGRTFSTGWETKASTWI